MEQLPDRRRAREAARRPFQARAALSRLVVCGTGTRNRLRALAVSGAKDACASVRHMVRCPMWHSGGDVALLPAGALDPVRKPQDHGWQ